VSDRVIDPLKGVKDLAIARTGLQTDCPLGHLGAEHLWVEPLNDEVGSIQALKGRHRYDHRINATRASEGKSAVHVSPELNEVEIGSNVVEQCSAPRRTCRHRCPGAEASKGSAHQAISWVAAFWHAGEHKTIRRARRQIFG